MCQGKVELKEDHDRSERNRVTETEKERKGEKEGEGERERHRDRKAPELKAPEGALGGRGGCRGRQGDADSRSLEESPASSAKTQPSLPNTLLSLSTSST